MKLIKVAIPTALALGRSRQARPARRVAMVAAVEAAATRPHAAERLSPRRGVAAAYPGGGHVAASHGPVYVAPRGHAVAVPRSYGYGYGGNHYHAPYYGHYPSYRLRVRPTTRRTTGRTITGTRTYSFHSHFSIGFGLYLGYPVPYPYRPTRTRIRRRIRIRTRRIGTRLRVTLHRTRIRIRRSIRAAPYQGGQYQDPQGGYPQDAVSAAAVSAAAATGTTADTRSRRAAR